ncbi:hypothetical protein [Paenibacillus alkalitolerans]|uniref:hypothetical protein n=1 Tax=Paenibacillus alkalitolerans TaxID=2799335 RepID=UPI0018F51D3B|nr:hypothetical protein [Paenibacillus alkalitolerans]
MSEKLRKRTTGQRKSGQRKTKARSNDNEFGPDTGFESESSVSDKAFLQAVSVNPIAQDAELPGDEEFAAEVAAPIADRPVRRDEARAAEREEAKARTTLGYWAIIASVLSLFWLPSILGPVSAVIGFMAFVRGSRALGAWSIVIGTIAFVSFLTTIPYNY